MPTTLTGLLLLVVLLLPGITFVAIRERGAPRQAQSPFRETATVATVSGLAILAVTVLFLIVRWALPRHTEAVDELIRRGWGPTRDHYPELAVWLIGALILATSITAGAARLLGRKATHPSAMSSWWMLFEHYNAGLRKHVRCVLDDGSWVEGRLASFNHASDDVADRDLILVDPIRFARNWDGKPEDPQVSAVCISARNVVTMFVSDIPEGWEDSTSSQTSQSSEAAAEASASESR